MLIRVIRYAFVLGFVLSLAIGMVVAQADNHPKSATAKATKTRGEPGGTDENIKKDRAPNDPNTNIEAPPEKGGPKTRGGSCRIHIDNRTPYYIDIYTDGDYRGEVSPWGDSVGWVGCGDTKFFGRATFTDGSSQVWGPSIYYLDGSFTWTLTR